jgi:hypothetical protein
VALLDDFIARFPEIDSDTANLLVPIYAEIWPCYYGGSYEDNCDKQAILLLMAHLVKTDPSVSSSAPSRAASSKSVGSVSVSYDSLEAQSNTNAWLNSTRYGQMFLVLTAKNRGPVFA